MPMSDNESLNTGAIQTWPGLGPNMPRVEQFLTFEGTVEAQTKLAAGIAAARLEFGQIERSRTGQYGNNKFVYAPLGNLTEATAKPLAAQGISVMNFFTTSPNSPDKQRLTTWVLGHGARIVACLDYAPREAKEDGAYKGEFIKELGKLQTYLVRYQYRALFTLDSEPDADDAPVEPERPREPRREAPRPEARPEPQRASQPVPAPRAEQPKPQQPTPPPAPAKPEPPPPPLAAAAPDEPEADTLKAINTLFSELGLTKISFNQLCIDLLDMPFSEVRTNRAAAQTVLENLQTKVLGKKAAQQQVRPS